MNNKVSIGIDLGGTHIRAARIACDLSIEQTIRRDTPHDGGPERIIACIEAMVRRLRPEHDPIAGIGIGAPGPLNPDTGRVCHMPNLSGWSDVPLVQILEESLDCPVYLINDADAAAMGEYLKGSARGVPLFMMFTLGTGLGSSLMIRGAPWTGEDGFSTEFGHIPLFGDGDQCGCGGYAHAETRLSTWALWQDYQHRGGSMPVADSEFPPVKLLFEAARNGDAHAGAVVASYGMHLGRLLATAATALNVRTFVLGGGIAAAWDQLETTAMDAVATYGFSPLSDHIGISVGVLGDRAGLIGAAGLVFNRAIRKK